MLPQMKKGSAPAEPEGWLGGAGYSREINPKRPHNRTNARVQGRIVAE
jgi:hypothetical protein